jgi:hypothetical protein
MRTRHWAEWVVVGVIGAAGCTGQVTEGTSSGAGSGPTSGSSTSSGSTGTTSSSESTGTTSSSGSTTLTCPLGPQCGVCPEGSYCFAQDPCGDWESCTPFPAACDATPTCDCVLAQNPDSEWICSDYGTNVYVSAPGGSPCCE